MKEVTNNIENKDEFFRKLVEEFTPMIGSIISQYNLAKGDFSVSKEDLYQEACLALYEAYSEFKDDYGASFSTFAYIVIKRRLNKIYYHLVRQYENEGISYDRFCKDHTRIMEYTVQEKGLNYKAEQLDKMHEILDSDSLTDEDKAIIQMRLDGTSYKEIATALNINLKRVDNRIMRIKRILKLKMDK